MIKYRQKEYSTGALNKLLAKGREIKDTLGYAMINPGEVVNSKIIEPSIKSPITAVALKAVPVPGSSAAIGTVGKPERWLWKKVGVSKHLDKASNNYENSKTARLVKGIINGAVEGTKTILQGL